MLWPSSRPLSATRPAARSLSPLACTSLGLRLRQNLRQFDSVTWMSELGLGPFASVTEDIRVKMKVASTPAGEIEEQDTTRVLSPLPTARSRCSVLRSSTSNATGFMVVLELITSAPAVLAARATMVKGCYLFVLVARHHLHRLSRR